MSDPDALVVPLRVQQQAGRSEGVAEKPNEPAADEGKGLTAGDSKDAAGASAPAAAKAPEVPFDTSPQAIEERRKKLPGWMRNHFERRRAEILKSASRSANCVRLTCISRCAVSGCRESKVL